MRNSGTLGTARFRCANFKIAVHGDGVAVDDFAAKKFGECEGKSGFAAGSRAKNYDQ
jgi:hypothetical protein